MMRRMEQLKGLLKTGVAAAALYAGGMGLGQAEPALDYISNEAVAPIVQTVQQAQASKVQLNRQLFKDHLEQLKDNVNGGAWFSGNEGQVRDSLDLLGQTKVGQRILSQLPDNQNFRIATSSENEIGLNYGIAGGYRYDSKEIMFFPWLLNQLPEQLPLLILHEGMHCIQELEGKSTYQDSFSPYVYNFGEQLIEAEAVATELELLREKPELMPQGNLKNGRDNLAPFYNQMWQKNYDACQNEDQATQMTRKQFIQKMILNQNPNYEYTDQMSAEEKCNSEITRWKSKYIHQSERNFDESLKKKMDAGQEIVLNEYRDLNKVKELGQLFGYTPDESCQMYNSICQNDDTSFLDMKMLSLKQNPKNFKGYLEKTEVIYQNFKKDVSEKGSQFAQDKLKSQLDFNQTSKQRDLLKTLHNAQVDDKSKGIKEQLIKAQQGVNVKQKINPSNISVAAAMIRSGAQNR